MSKASEKPIPVGSKKYRPYLQLGLGLAAHYGVGPKAALLDVAVRYGLPVPAGIILLHEAYEDALSEGLVEAETRDGLVHIHCSRPDRLIGKLNLPNFEWEFPGPFAVRPAFSAEDSEEGNLAGYFTSRLNVDAPDQLVAALCAVWESADSLGDEAGKIRRDVLIMKMVKAQNAGVAFTEHAFEDDLIHFTESAAGKRTSGQIEGDSLLLPKLRAGEARIGPSDLPAWAGRLQHLLRDVRARYSHRKTPRNWEVEWADDGEKCYLIQIRPLTSPTRRNEVFLITNHEELSPLPPSRLITSMIESCAGDIIAYFRTFDRSLPENRPLIEVFNGRPYINLSLLSEMMRMWGLPTRLVANAIGGQADPESPANWRRIISKLIPLARWALAQIRANGATKRIEQKILRRTGEPGSTFGENIETMGWLYTTLMRGMFSLRAREMLHSHAIKAFDQMRETFLTLAEQTVQNGQLPTPETIWDLNLDEVRKLDAGWKPDADFLEARKAEIERLSTLPAPDLLHRFDDLSRISAR